MVFRWFSSAVYGVYSFAHYSMVPKWETVGQRPGGEYRIFRTDIVQRRHPVHLHVSEFVVVHPHSWVNILPITPENEVVMIHQYRHGIDDVTLEIPGGMVEPGEDPREAGMRECTEETGFAGIERAEYLGEVHPNPAFLSNTCYSYVWLNCTLHSEQKLDRNEDIVVEKIPLEHVAELIRSGRIAHSLVLNAFMLYWMNPAFTNKMFS
jgi:8-oxo-dGTP pyrophosphatase MutT (NUDIX family)